jgi:3-phenylpropionate/trans-cinnamate dioxygenase ferredoxin reductase subunit
VTVLLDTSVASLFGANGEVRGVVTAEGRKIEADVVVIGVGVMPAIELADGAGLPVSNGVVVDRQCRTRSNMVWAAGDVACQPDFFDADQLVRLETFQNAQDQAVAAAASMMGKPVNYSQPSWFWTDQYNLNIQVCGRIDDGALRIVRGTEQSESFSVYFLREDVIEGVLAVNRAQDMAVGRRMVERRTLVPIALLADEAVPLRSLIAGKR